MTTTLTDLISRRSLAHRDEILMESTNIKEPVILTVDILAHCNHQNLGIFEEQEKESRHVSLKRVKEWSFGTRFRLWDFGGAEGS